MKEETLKGRILWPNVVDTKVDIVLSIDTNTEMSAAGGVVDAKMNTERYLNEFTINSSLNPDSSVSMTQEVYSFQQRKKLEASQDNGGAQAMQIDEDDEKMAEEMEIDNDEEEEVRDVYLLENGITDRFFTSGNFF